MKVTPVSTGGNAIGQSAIATERTSPDRIAAAKAVAMGESPMRMVESDTPTDPQVRKAQESIRRIKMKVQQSTNRVDLPDEPVTITNQEQTTLSATPEVNEEVVSEETKPLSPQFAALAKQRRALQVKERELVQREEALKAQPSTDAGGELAAQLKSQPLRVLEEQGVLTPEFYDSLTEYLVSGTSQSSQEMRALKEEIKALKEGVDKNFTERDTAAEQQVLAEMRKEAESLAREGETYELVRETRSVPRVMDLIHRTYKQTGEVLDVSEAMQLIEDQLFEDNFKIANLKKIQSKFVNPQPPQNPLQSQRPQQMRTLTNRDTAQVPLDRRTRAMMAAQGLLKRG